MPPSLRKYTPVPFHAVKINDSFWSPRIQVNREVTLATEYSQLKDTGRIDAFRKEWTPGKTPLPHFFWDSDVAKWIEATSYSLASHPDGDLDALLDEVIALIASAQEADGYLNTYFSVVEPEGKFTDLRDAHELYCAGHLIEAAVAHFQATGKRTLLNPMIRYVDLIGSVFGCGPGQKQGYCGHEEIELALVKLYRATGEGRFLELSRYFVDQRGQAPVYFDQETAELARMGKKNHFAPYFEQSMGSRFDYRYVQAHVPVREQSVVGGHAVRAMYLFSAMADLAGETGDAALLAACERLWDNLVHRRMYLTGGIGNSRSNEGFTFDYDLDNETAYAETCAAVGLVLWSHRLLQLSCDSRYADVMERALYNGVISGISLDGKSFFYVNPLASTGGHHRQPWFDCACCPPNVARLLASLGEYIYAISNEDIAVHLYAAGEAKFAFRGQNVSLTQTTRYPWDGEVTLRIGLETADRFGLKLRLPGWCRSARAAVNGQPVDSAAGKELGYLRIERDWQPGDVVQLILDMPVERVYAHPSIRQNAGKVALQRGPIVFCLEQADHAAPLVHLRLPAGATVEASFAPDRLGGVIVLKALACAEVSAGWENAPYQTVPPATEDIPLTAVPYYTWDNREPGAMLVWIAEK
jgi:uncharacterized protein